MRPVIKSRRELVAVNWQGEGAVDSYETLLSALNSLNRGESARGTSVNRSHI